MRLSAAAGGAILCALATAAPSTPAPLASKHNIYLATCSRPRSCLLIICDSPSPFTAAAYYPNGASTAAKPSDITTITDPASPWEGASRQGRFTTGTVTSTIDVGAKGLKKGDIAGGAKLGSEEFVCFKDGVSKFEVSGWDDWELQRVSCVADYWCASTG
jgi:hypothetical protein